MTVVHSQVESVPSFFSVVSYRVRHASHDVQPEPSYLDLPFSFLVPRCEGCFVDRIEWCSVIAYLDVYLTVFVIDVHGDPGPLLALFLPVRERVRDQFLEDEVHSVDLCVTPPVFFPYRFDA